MGHKRLGELPNTGGWKRFKSALGDTSVDAETTAEAAFEALSRFMPALSDEPGLGYCFWMLTQVIWESRRSDYFEILRQRGVDVGNPDQITSPVSFISRLSENAQEALRSDPTASVFSNVAQLAMRETLTRAFASQVRTLFGTASFDVRSACQRFATTKQFGGLSRGFFASYLSRLLGYFIEREIPSHVGPKARFKTQDDLDRFQATVTALSQKHAEALELYFRERSQIIESYAGGYGSLHTYHEDLSLNSIRRDFIPRALDKLRAELSRSETKSDAAWGEA